MDINYYNLITKKRNKHVVDILKNTCLFKVEDNEQQVQNLKR